MSRIRRRANDRARLLCAARKRHARRFDLINRSVRRVELSRQIIERDFATGSGDPFLLARSHSRDFIPRDAIAPVAIRLSANRCFADRFPFRDQTLQLFRHCQKFAIQFHDGAARLVGLRFFQLRGQFFLPAFETENVHL